MIFMSRDVLVAAAGIFEMLERAHPRAMESETILILFNYLRSREHEQANTPST